MFTPSLSARLFSNIMATSPDPTTRVTIKPNAKMYRSVMIHPLTGGRITAPRDKIDGTQSPTKSPSSRDPKNQSQTDNANDAKAPRIMAFRARRDATYDPCWDED